jgi:hypothetical protein
MIPNALRPAAVGLALLVLASCSETATEPEVPATESASPASLAVTAAVLTFRQVSGAETHLRRHHGERGPLLGPESLRRVGRWHDYGPPAAGRSGQPISLLADL